MKKITILITAAIIGCINLHVLRASSEFYLKINISGKFTVNIADQSQSSSTGEFRFHGIPSGTWPLMITNENDKSIMNFSMVLSNSIRTICEISLDKKIALVGNLQINERYWYLDYLEPNFGGTTMGTQVGVDESKFSLMWTHVKKQDYDNYRLLAAQEVTKDAGLSSVQIASLCKLFDYDTDRLTYAKYAYDYVVDKPMFFTVYDSFDYSSSSNTLREYIASH